MKQKLENKPNKKDFLAILVLQEYISPSAFTNKTFHTSEEHQIPDKSRLIDIVFGKAGLKLGQLQPLHAPTFSPLTLVTGPWQTVSLDATQLQEVCYEVPDASSTCSIYPTS